jgi:hypothetical protein
MKRKAPLRFGAAKTQRRFCRFRFSKKKVRAGFLTASRGKDIINKLARNAQIYDEKGGNSVDTGSNSGTAVGRSRRKLPGFRAAVSG